MSAYAQVQIYQHSSWSFRMFQFCLQL
jgi:hypothetical protein